MNYVRTGMLLAALAALFMAAGYLVAGTGGMIIALLLAGGMNLFAWWNSGQMVLRMYRALEVDARTAPGLHGIVRQLAGRAELPMPRVYLIDNPQPNAFATGRGPNNAAVAATTGLLDQLSREEIAGVMAHELAHVKNRDTLTMTITATIAGAIGMLANFALFFGAFGGGNRNNPLGIVGVLLVELLAPVAAMMVQFAISRAREVRGRPHRRRYLRPTALAGLGLGQAGPRRCHYRQSAGRAESRHGAFVHRQPIARPCR